MSKHNHALEELRSSVADAAFAVEERLLWRGEDGMKSLLDAARWPFERAVWALERGVIWPLEERTGDWSDGMRTLGVAVAALIATAAGVLGLLWAAGGSNGGGTTRAQAPAAGPAPIARTPIEAASPAAPVLHGVKPDFKAVGGDAKGGAESTEAGSVEAGSAESPATVSSASAKPVEAGPAATKVAHRFAGAFVLYETGHIDRKVRTAFAETATPPVAQKLLHRPPRLPANTEVPEAKVLNIVPGPRHGNTYTLSVSLLRLGLTSELRLDLRQDKQSGKWQVTDVRG
jgi:hypothetical protein